jgi:hypothetical protein
MGLGGAVLYSLAYLAVRGVAGVVAHVVPLPSIAQSPERLQCEKSGCGTGGMS